jgi:hypothetical protein
MIYDTGSNNKTKDMEILNCRQFNVYKMKNTLDWPCTVP